MPRDTWRAGALAEIRGIKRPWVKRYGWCPRVKRGRAWIDLFVTFTRRGPEPALAHTLRLRYEPNYKTAGRREDFVDPSDLSHAGPEHWPQGMRSVAMRDRPYLCLEGTWGFHSLLHTDRPGARASLNRLLMEIERCLNG